MDTKYSNRILVNSLWFFTGSILSLSLVGLFYFNFLFEENGKQNLPYWYSFIDGPVLLMPLAILALIALWRSGYTPFTLFVLGFCLTAIPFNLIGFVLMVYAISFWIAVSIIRSVILLIKKHRAHLANPGGSQIS
jgi:hypothetical protein